MNPFRNGDAYAAFDSIRKSTVAEINALDNEYVLKASVVELEKYFIDKCTVAPLVLHVDQLHIEPPKGVDVDVSHDFRRGFFHGERTTVRGTSLTIVIPYEGQKNLWNLRASTFNVSGYPDIQVADTKIAFSVSYPDDAANDKEIRGEIDRHTNSLKSGVEYIMRDVQHHNNELSKVVGQALERKRKQAEVALGVLANLGLPIKRKEEAPAFALPVKQKPSPVRPAITQGNYAPEHALAEEEYQHILKILRSASLVMERCPGAFETIDEEAIRMTFLILLNGHYEGQATGETFNSAGKTDIIVRWENRNVFIAECKFWTGPAGFNETIDQILNYLTWRDTKCALLIFNTNKDSAGVKEKMHDVMQARSEFRKVVSYDKNGDGRYVLVKPTEPGSEITVTTQLYDIPRTAEEKPLRERRMRKKERET